MRHILTTTPTAIPDVEEGTRYTVQNRSPHTVYIQPATEAPTNTEEAFTMRPNGFLSAGVFRTGPGQSIYVWVADTSLGSGALVYDEAA